jgi:hypothetical protein
LALAPLVIAPVFGAAFDGMVELDGAVVVAPPRVPV